MARSPATMFAAASLAGSLMATIVRFSIDMLCAYGHRRACISSCESEIDRSGVGGRAVTFNVRLFDAPAFLHDSLSSPPSANPTREAGLHPPRLSNVRDTQATCNFLRYEIYTNLPHF